MHVHVFHLVDPLRLELEVIQMKKLMKKNDEADETHQGVAGKTSNIYMSMYM